VLRCEPFGLVASSLAVGARAFRAHITLSRACGEQFGQPDQIAGDGGEGERRLDLGETTKLGLGQARLDLPPTEHLFDPLAYAQTRRAARMACRAPVIMVLRTLPSFETLPFTAMYCSRSAPSTAAPSAPNRTPEEASRAPATRALSMAARSSNTARRTRVPGIDPSIADPPQANQAVTKGFSAARQGSRAHPA